METINIYCVVLYYGCTHLDLYVPGVVGVVVCLCTLHWHHHYMLHAHIRQA